MKRFVLAAAMMSMMAAGAQAQSTFVWPSSQAGSNGPGLKYYIPMGTPLMLRTLNQINTREAHVGDRIYMQVAEPIMFRGQTIIPEGSPAIGEVSELQRNGHFGRKGKVAVRVIEVQTPSGPVQLSGRAYDEGRSGTAISVGTIMVVSVLGFLIHGTSGDIPAGTSVRSYLGERMNFRWNGEPEQQAVATEAVPDKLAVASAAFAK